MSDVFHALPDLVAGRVGQKAQSSAPVLLSNGILSSHEVIELFEL